MSKKVNVEAATTATLKEYFEKYPNASIRKLAQATGINYGILLKKSKDPIPGEAYDPEAINWAAVEAKLIAKGINWSELDWDVMNSGRTHNGPTLPKDVNEFKVGDLVYLRKDNITPYQILYKTETHLVIMKQGTSEPQAWSNNTFMLNGPSFQPRAEKITAEVETDEVL